MLRRGRPFVGSVSLGCTAPVELGERLDRLARRFETSKAHLIRPAFRRRLGLWIITLEDDAPRVLVLAAYRAYTRREGTSLAMVLRVWLGFPPDADQSEHDPFDPAEGDRLLGLVSVFGRPSWIDR